MDDVKVVFLDMDGTVLNHHNRITEKTIKAIDALRSKGIKVCIATGRSMKEIEDVAPNHLSVDGIVSANGMVASIGDRTIVENSLPNELINEIVEKARQLEIYYEIHPNVGSRITLKQDQAYIQAIVQDPKPNSVALSEWLSRKAAIDKDIKWTSSVGIEKYSKMYFFSRDKEKMLQWIKELEKLKEKQSFTTSTSSNHNVEVMVANINKATGIEYLLKEFTLSKSEAMAIGDSNNDIPMLKMVGYPIAMKNGSDEVRQLVDEVTAFSCDEDGVYHYLKDKFELKGIE
ncbi:Cof-type HAD-IIB family hydrolase [Aquibacillus kalidii]|uniref:Cof-type HAD-IIB family hydrolase n=1 Tax=Aquibacillus kalidii TaxID=2762597 RepID=UPI002E2A3DFE|nr:Cof-type HAD-IIB family hydrolase [Aquibacillus kalidii]